MELFGPNLDATQRTQLLSVVTDHVREMVGAAPSDAFAYIGAKTSTTASDALLELLLWALDHPSWERRADTPQDVEVTGTAITCGADGPVLLTAGGEVSYNAATDEWTSRPAQAPGIVAAMLALNYHGILADGTSYAIDPGGEVFRRTTASEWSDTGIRGNQLVTTPTRAFAVGPDVIVTVP